ncbi:diaminopimelate decarboxylase [Curtobacterium citreum]|uniref:Diaminopimelate decarboxylase n=1 Tax=Curtobacterium citreum TaxID=2036 RepID=A0ABT2HDX4_9MICO|nr:diaminopimelate decarboxylase [Curtobacterium citreum]MCS6521475.1 diaminopimelate decarboxylase [Curtobacterium citreum]TQJ28332.1 diaminopimelate decarboxylase [Curtobacterium citreum]GGL75976.1 diaminopimelate decarboxylase [Curtobacterium citreum]
MSENPLAPPRLRVPDDASALTARIWPASATRTDDGSLAIGGVAAADLVAQYGTPLYVVDERDVQSRAVRVRTAFDDAFGLIGTRAHVYYAAKAFLTTQVATWMAEADLRVDVCTGGELAVALAGGVDPARLGFHGNDKSDAEIARAVEVGLGTIVLDSHEEIGRVARAAADAGTVQRVRIRINSGVHASTHEYLATAREDQKFGIPLTEAVQAAAAVRAEPSLAFVGLHSHIGSQIFDESGFREAARRLMDVHAELVQSGPVPELNLGGGWGIDYTEADEAFAPEDVAEALATIVAEACAERDIPVPEIAVEPGRYIVGPAGVTLYRVGTIKPVALETEDGASATRTYVSVDGGMSDNARPALYGADYTARLARTSDAPAVLTRVVGKHCESGDIVVHDEYLPGDVHRGDLLAVAATGAYCWALSSNYNHVGRPPVVAVADGAARTLVRGESIDDLLARDTGVVPAPAAGAAG